MNCYMRSARKVTWVVTQKSKWTHKGSMSSDNNSANTVLNKDLQDVPVSKKLETKTESSRVLSRLFWRKQMDNGISP
jgi:hypothetical protein